MHVLNSIYVTIRISTLMFAWVVKIANFKYPAKQTATYHLTWYALFVMVWGTGFGDPSQRPFQITVSRFFYE